MGKARRDRLQGSLDLLVLKTLSVEPNHGYGIAQHIKKASENILQVEEGSLYPALHRLARGGLVKAQWKMSETGRRAKYYGLTWSGRKYLAAEEANWVRTIDGVRRVLQYA